MNEEQRASVSRDETTFSRLVGAQAARKLKARRVAPKSIWFGLGMSGLVGWSVTIPTLVGAALGMWVDQRFPSPYSWTLMLLFMGLITGCLNAWLWVQSEYKEMQEDPDE
jgi:ATP synthase protein I